jgi:chitodextrinase
MSKLSTTVSGATDHEIGTTTATSFLDAGLMAATEHTYQIIAVDTSNNESAPSTPANARTDLLPAVSTDGLALWFKAGCGGSAGR